MFFLNPFRGSGSAPKSAMGPLSSSIPPVYHNVLYHTLILRLISNPAFNVLVDFNASIAYNVSMLSHGISPMATLTIRNVEPAVKERLRVRAARNGRSMEAELRAIVAEAVGGERRREVGLAEAIRRRFAAVGGVDDLIPHPEVPVGEPPEFDS